MPKRELWRVFLLLQPFAALQYTCLRASSESHELGVDGSLTSPCSYKELLSSRSQNSPDIAFRTPEKPCTGETKVELAREMLRLLKW